MGFQARLEYIIGYSGVTKKRFAEKAGISKNQIFNYLKEGGQEPSAKFFRNIKACYPWINLEWLIAGIGAPVLSVNGEGASSGEDNHGMALGTGPLQGVADTWKPQETGCSGIPQCEKPDLDKYFFIPMAEARLSAGGGEFVASEGIKDYYAFRKPFIRHIATSSKNLVLMRVSGNSMEPEIRNGGTVMIDTGRCHIKGGCYFALGFHETIAIKLLEMLPGGKVSVISINRVEYPPYEAELESVRILGQVIWGDRMFPI